MNKTSLLKLFLLMGFSTISAYAQNIQSRIDSLYKVNENSPGFSIAVFKGDSIILERQYGIANLDYNVPITDETVFDVGSIAKQFTAFAILLLEEQGKLILEEAAYKYLGKLPRYEKGDPTVEQLLNQTSGIREVDLVAGVADLCMQDMLSQSQMVNFITKINDLNFKPGEYFQYTNSNYILLAEIVANVSGMSFSQFMEEKVFIPFGMKNTVKKASTYSIIKNRAIGYQEDEGTYYKTHLHSFVYDGDGQVLTNPKDIFKWHQGLKKTKDRSPALYKKMHQRAKLNSGVEIDFGLGVEFEEHSGYSAMGFDGMIQGGFVSKYLFFPELDIAFFTTQNTFDWDFDDRFFQLVDMFVPQEDIVPNQKEKMDGTAVALSENERKKYEGDYLFMGSDDEERKMNRIRIKGRQLAVLTMDGEEITELEPLGNHQFMFNGNLVRFNIKNNVKSYQYYSDEQGLPWIFKAYEPHAYSVEELREFEGEFLNASLQISKKIKLLDNKLYFFYRNGAWKDEMEVLSKDTFDISFRPIKFRRNNDGRIIGLEITGIYFEKV